MLLNNDEKIIGTYFHSVLIRCCYLLPILNWSTFSIKQNCNFYVKLLKINYESANSDRAGLMAKSETVF